VQGVSDHLTYCGTAGTVAFRIRRADLLARTVGVPRKVWYAPALFLTKGLNLLAAEASGIRQSVVLVHRLGTVFVLLLVLALASFAAWAVLASSHVSCFRVTL
jgi:hypothetical protein